MLPWLCPPVHRRLELELLELGGFCSSLQLALVSLRPFVSKSLPPRHELASSLALAVLVTPCDGRATAMAPGPSVALCASQETQPAV
jgi:hypothetical protein